MIMNQQISKPGIGDKIIIGLMSIVLFVAGFFASLLALAIAGAMALFVLGKIWWMRRRSEKSFIEGKYRVVRE